MNKPKRLYVLLISQLDSLDKNHAYLLFSMSFIALFSAQLILALRWGWRANLQAGEFYRQFTGYLLLAYVLLQSRLGIKRIRHQLNNLRNAFDIHKIQGVFGPILFYIHSIEIGFAYQTVLAVVFLGNCIIGYLSPHALQWRNNIYLLS